MGIISKALSLVRNIKEGILTKLNQQTETLRDAELSLLKEGCTRGASLFIFPVASDSVLSEDGRVSGYEF